MSSLFIKIFSSRGCWFLNIFSKVQESAQKNLFKKTKKEPAEKTRQALFHYTPRLREFFWSINERLYLDIHAIQSFYRITPACAGIWTVRKFRQVRPRVAGKLHDAIIIAHHSLLCKFFYIFEILRRSFRVLNSQFLTIFLMPPISYKRWKIAKKTTL